MDILTTLVIIATIGIIVNIIISLTRKKVDYNQEFKGLESIIREEVKGNRTELAESSRLAQEQFTNQLGQFGESQKTLLGGFQSQLQGLTTSNQKGFADLNEQTAKSISDIRFDVGRKLEAIQKDNNTQLEKMRHTVDEKLEKTLETRLGKSFELVSKRLEEVQKGLGEMQTLANGVGDLKKVLSNVKTRGVMGEIQLGSILEQILTNEQYGINVATIPGSGCHVEFAIKMPGKDDSNGSVWLPIDAKFPMDKYEQLQDAYDDGDKAMITGAKKALISTIHNMAKDISSKYISPPHTTDFGILFLPTEGLYADVVREPGIMQDLQNKYKIMIAGPSNLAAMLNSLQMGFKTLAIQQRSSEVWDVLSTVKIEFGKFGAVIDKVETKLNQATKTIQEVGTRTRVMERSLRKVEELPSNGQHYLEDGLDMDDLKVGA